MIKWGLVLSVMATTASFYASPDLSKSQELEQLDQEKERLDQEQKRLEQEKENLNRRYTAIYLRNFYYDTPCGQSRVIDPVSSHHPVPKPIFVGGAPLSQSGSFGKIPSKRD